MLGTILAYKIVSLLLALKAELHSQTRITEKNAKDQFQSIYQENVNGLTENQILGVKR